MGQTEKKADERRSPAKDATSDDKREHPKDVVALSGLDKKKHGVEARAGQLVALPTGEADRLIKAELAREATKRDRAVARR